MESSTAVRTTTSASPPSLALRLKLNPSLCFNFADAPEVFATPSRGTGDAFAATAARLFGLLAPVIKNCRSPSLSSLRRVHPRLTLSFFLFPSSQGDPRTTRPQYSFLLLSLWSLGCSCSLFPSRPQERPLSRFLSSVHLSPLLRFALFLSG